MTTTTPPEQVKHHWIRRFRVDGGYINGLDLELDPRGNVIIGEPGTGKSTFLTLIRFTLAIPVPAKMKESVDELLAANLGAGRAYITIVTPYEGELTFSRALGEDAPRLESSTQGTRDVRLTPELFPIQFAGHGEFQLMATDGMARLALLKRFAGEDLARVEKDLDRVRRDMDANAKSLVQVETDIEDRAKQTSALPSERARLDELKRAGGDDPLDLDAANQQKALRERERMMLESAQRDVEWLQAEVFKLISVARRRLSQSLDAEVSRGENSDLLADVAAEIQRTAGGLEEMATRVGGLCERARGSFAERARSLTERHRSQDDAYRVLLGKHEHDAGRASERIKLEKSVAILSKAREEHDASVHERAQYMAVRDGLRGRQEALIATSRTLLEATCVRVSELLGKRVEVTMELEAERTKYTALLKTILKGKRFEAETLELLARSMTPQDLFAQVMAGNASLIAEKVDSETVAHRLVGALLESKRVYELETVEVSDVPSVALLHGDQYKKSAQQSSGQRTVSFLSLMLLDRRGPFIADQPEDSTPNRYLAEHLCPVFSDVQSNGQFVIVTHNANLPILGMAKRVIEFQASGSHGWVERLGTPKEVVKPMENVLEGGRNAFVKRKDFYGL